MGGETPWVIGLRHRWTLIQQIFGLLKGNLLVPLRKSQQGLFWGHRCKEHEHLEKGLIVSLYLVGVGDGWAISKGKRNLGEQKWESKVQHPPTHPLPGSWSPSTSSLIEDSQQVFIQCSDESGSPCSSGSVWSSEMPALLSLPFCYRRLRNHVSRYFSALSLLASLLLQVAPPSLGKMPRERRDAFLPLHGCIRLFREENRQKQTRKGAFKIGVFLEWEMDSEWYVEAVWGYWSTRMYCMGTVCKTVAQIPVGARQIIWTHETEEVQDNKECGACRQPRQEMAWPKRFQIHI